jgi:hypothetical protein
MRVVLRPIQMSVDVEMSQHSNDADMLDEPTDEALESMRTHRPSLSSWLPARAPAAAAVSRKRYHVTASERKAAEDDTTIDEPHYKVTNHYGFF